MDDTAQITALIQGYADAIDRGDLDALADSFADAVLRSPRGVARGRAAVRRWYDAVLLDEHGLPGTRHHVFGVEVDIQTGRDRATATSFVTVVQGGRPIIAGRYDDAFVHGPEGWRFAERVVHLDLLGDLSGHLRSRTPQPSSLPRIDTNDTISPG